MCPVIRSTVLTDSILNLNSLLLPENKICILYSVHEMDKIDTEKGSEANVKQICDN